MFEFQAICGGPRSAFDYIEVASCYHTVLISQIPQMTDETKDMMRRFIALIDEFYERHVKLVLLAEVSCESLYVGTQLKFEFARTLSRLTQMRSQNYLQLAHKFA